MKEIIMTVDFNGAVAVETKGFKGKACLKASAFLEHALGTEVSSQLLPSYYEFDADAMNAPKKFVAPCNGR
jgi:hypothetical protein